jgi:hypothetical protein
MWWRYSFSSHLCDFFWVPLPGNTSTSRSLQHCTAEIQVTYDSFLPFSQHTLPCANPFAGVSNHFKIHAFSVIPITQLPVSPWITVSIYIFPTLARLTTSHYSLLQFSKTHHTPLLCPASYPKVIKPWVLALLQPVPFASMWLHNSTICSPLAHRWLLSFLPLKIAL